MTTITIISIIIFVLCWVCIIYEIKNAPLMDDEGLYEIKDFKLCPKCNKRLIKMDGICLCETKNNKNDKRK